MPPSHKAPSSVGGASAVRSPLASLPPVKLDSLTKLEQMKIRKSRKKRRARRRRGLDRKLAHMDDNITSNMEDSENEDAISDQDEDEDEDQHMPCSPGDEPGDSDPDCYYYRALVAARDLDR
ncbi:uncharacterized protein PG998_001292 [Apiospora kogelbergensis]|uniref:uncharacterized protein n=1 Tax=Apiospora kogelbergensis TaxID=1337665 RepID=UPI003130AB9A